MQLQSRISPLHSTLLYYKSTVRAQALNRRNKLQSSVAPLSPDTYDKLTQHFCNDILTPIYGTIPRQSSCYAPHVSLKPVIAGYYPIGSELDVVPLLQRFYGHNHRIALPVVVDDPDDGEAPLVFWEWVPGSRTVAGKFNIPIPIRDETHPIRPDILFIPLVAFDSQGRRVGYGGGYYDRAIARLRQHNRSNPNPGLTERHWSSISTFASLPEFPLLICGFGFDQQKQEDLHEIEESHDQRLDVVLTEKNIYICNRGLKDLIAGERQKKLG